MLRILLLVLFFFTSQSVTQQTRKDDVQIQNPINAVSAKNDNKYEATRYNNLPCNGWCLSNMDNITQNELFRRIHPINQINNEAQKQRYNLLRTEIKENPYVPLRASSSIYADKSVYTDMGKASPRTLLFRKDIVKVPSDVFYPITRDGLKKVMRNSGLLYLPSEEENAELAEKEQDILQNVYGTKELFTNSYFEANPYLYSRTLPKRYRKKAKIERNEDIYPEDYSDEVIDLFGRRDIRNNSLHVRTTNIDEFLNGKLKRSHKTRTSEEVRELLGVPEEMLLDKPDNDVDDIVAGMKTKKRNPPLFVIGATDKAQDDLQLWIQNSKARASNVQNPPPDSGIILKGETKQYATNKLLRSMLVNYQYRCGYVCYGYVRRRRRRRRRRRLVYAVGGGASICFTFMFLCG